MNNRIAIGFLPVIPIRAIPSDASEMVSQLLFGEMFEVLENNGNWILISTCYDHYRGWIDEKQALYLNKPTEHDQYVTLQPISVLKKGRDSLPFYLPAGSSLPAVSDGEFFFKDEVYRVMDSDIGLPDIKDFKGGVISHARKFLDAPYLWGGRTVFGIDCSGFTQVAFKMLGIKLLRDASQQATQGDVVDFLSEAQAGDLAFFDNEEGRITHVGIMLNNHEIIHASGRVKIDNIDNQGIFSGDLKRYTHKLRIIKRFI